MARKAGFGSCGFVGAKSQRVSVARFGEKLNFGRGVLVGDACIYTPREGSIYEMHPCPKYCIYIHTVIPPCMIFGLG